MVRCVYILALSAVVTQVKLNGCLVEYWHNAKSYGKSKGIQVVIGNWKEFGHTVIYIDMKGQPFNFSSSRVLQHVVNQIDNLPIVRNKFGCLYRHVLSKCSILVESSEWYKLLESLSKVTAGLCGALVPVLMRLLSINCLVKYFCKLWPYLVSVVIFVAILGNMPWFKDPMLELLDPVHQRISSGDWNTLSCVCNGIATCTP